jgi:hypothetical protein
MIPLVSDVFKEVRKSRKGRDIEKILTQLFCFFIDGSKFSMSYFDELAKDEGYIKTIESKKNDLRSSHVMKRFFNKAKSIMFKELQKIL